jgi:hypothetical protein
MKSFLRSWTIAAFAASTLVVGATAEAGIFYAVTNATSVQSGYSLSGYIEVAGTGNLRSLSSWNVTASLGNNPTFTLNSAASGDFYLAGNGAALYATDSALYVPATAYMRIEDSNAGVVWRKDYGSRSQYSAFQNVSPYTEFWYSETFPVSDSNGWKIGSVMAAPVPEIDPATGASALSLVAGVLAMVEQRRRRGLEAVLAG